MIIFISNRKIIKPLEVHCSKQIRGNTLCKQQKHELNIPMGFELSPQGKRNSMKLSAGQGGGVGASIKEPNKRRHPDIQPSNLSSIQSVSSVA